MKKSNKSTKVIVITDIGNDIDDTLALLLLLGAKENVDVVAVVTSVNDGLQRGRVVRGFLRVLGFPDKSVEILPSVDNFKSSGCHVPADFPSIEDSEMGSPEDTPQRILDLCKKYKEDNLVVLGIAGLGPLSEAISLEKKQSKRKSVLKRAIKHIYLQGNVEIESKKRRRRTKTRIRPHPAAYNFQANMEAASKVFDFFQESCAFTTLGKFAAYQIPITKGNFSNWTASLKKAWLKTTKSEHDYEVPSPPNLLQVAKTQLFHFYSSNRSKFKSIYKMPQEAEATEDFSWFDRLPEDYICSRPYDPLLALILVEDAKNLPLEGSLMESEKVKTTFGSHRLYGNSPENHSVLDANLVHERLIEGVSRALL